MSLEWRPHGGGLPALRACARAPARGPSVGARAQAGACPEPLKEPVPSRPSPGRRGSVAMPPPAGSRGSWSPTHVQVTVLRARGLRAKGPGGTSDAYALIQVGKEKYATSVSERCPGAPVWREEATFELPPWPAPATLRLTVLHRALLGLDKFLGQAEVDLSHPPQGRTKTQWYPLKSKPGKKEKERGEIEVDIQFMRNNMTASMFDLSMKDKPRSPFGKLKDRIKGKRQDGLSDTASAIVPSMTHSPVDSDEESPTKEKKKKSKFKTLFSKAGLQKTSLSQSMSVLPTSKPEKVTLRPQDFRSRWEDDDFEDESSSTSESMSHKRTASADPKQLSQITYNIPKKEGLSLFSGLRSKNDHLSRSNVCINGNHVYMEQPEPKSETLPRDNTPSSSPSPQGFRKKHLFSSAENLSSRSSKELGDPGRMSPDRRLSGSPSKDSLKSLTLPSYKPLASGDLRENILPENVEAAKEMKENKKQENKKSSLLSLVTGKKEVAKNSEAENPANITVKEKEVNPAEVKGEEKPAEPVRGPLVDPGKDPHAAVSGQGKALNPFEEVLILDPETEPEPEPKPETKPTSASARAPQTKAVKPRVSPEAPPKATLLSSLCDSSLSFSGQTSIPGHKPPPSKTRQDSETQSLESLPGCSSLSPLTAPLSTSTPIESWPPLNTNQVDSARPSFLHTVKSQNESATKDSTSFGGLSEQPLVPLYPGAATSAEGANEISEVELVGPVPRKSTGLSGRKPAQSLMEEQKGANPEQLEEVQQKEKDTKLSQNHYRQGFGGYLSSRENASEYNEIITQGSSEGSRSPNAKLWMKSNEEFTPDSEALPQNTRKQPASPESQGNEDGEVSVHEKSELSIKKGDSSSPFDAAVQKGDVAGLTCADGQKKSKKSVSFYEHSLLEEDVEDSTIEKAGNQLSELKFKEKMAGDIFSELKPPASISRLQESDTGDTTDKTGIEVDPHSLPPEPKPRSIFKLNHDGSASLAGGRLSSSRSPPVNVADQTVGSTLGGESLSGGSISEDSSRQAPPLFRIEEYDLNSEHFQSKANDHEGLLSDPLKDLKSAPDLRSPVTGDLNLTLPSIPEATSDDERVDQYEEDKMAVNSTDPDEARTPFSSLSLACTKEGDQSPTESWRSEARQATSVQKETKDAETNKPEGAATSSRSASKEISALGIHETRVLGLAIQLSSPGSVEEQELKEDDPFKESGKPLSFSETPQASSISNPSLSEPFSPAHSSSSSPHSDTYDTGKAESPKKATAEGSADKVENSGKKKQLLRAWVSPSETQPVPTQLSGGAVSAKQRPHPVKPMNTTASKSLSTSLGTATIISENLINEAIIKKYNPSDPACAYAQLTHDELIQLVLKQKETINKKEFQVRELEDYIDNLLVRVMEETPNILRTPAQLGKKAGKM
ncbi:rab11 family-interacting protein 1 [Tachyglossus aculeatus]|uniref:rab11 family-interacting protein 1 n=1 Tax=Tachyglossus aculeatus TaxID=9261 RepID=UPI0018F7103D|nr:rab11 family-interacting protein 1 [Tachyglossus aculeatus]